jgi:hypothetical protein
MECATSRGATSSARCKGELSFRAFGRASVLTCDSLYTQIRSLRRLRDNSDGKPDAQNLASSAELIRLAERLPETQVCAVGW